jgi:virulence factor
MTLPVPAEKRKSGSLRVAIVGAGVMANHVHYPALASFEDVELAGVCDLDPQRLQATADRYGIEGRYTDYRRMVEETEPDAVYAIGQPHLMYDVWTWCLRQGRNLYVEKPLGLTLHQARSLAHLAEKHGCITQVSFQRRSVPLLVRLREACLRRGPIGHAVCEFYKHSPEAYLEARDHMMDDGVHAIDTLRWMCGGEVVEIESVTRRVGVPDLNFIAALLRFDNHATGAMLLSWTSGRRIFRVEMHGPGICAEADPEGEGRLYAGGDVRGETLATRAIAGSDQLYVYGGFAAKHREFLDAVRERRQPSSCFADALNTMEVAERILAQSLVRAHERRS